MTPPGMGSRKPEASIISVELQNCPRALVHGPGQQLARSRAGPTWELLYAPQTPGLLWG